MHCCHECPHRLAWKRWLDRLLMVNVLAFAGAGVFAIAVVRQGQGYDRLMDRVQVLALFAPAISLLIMAALVSGIFSWWQRRRRPGRGSGS